MPNIICPKNKYEAELTSFEVPMEFHSAKGG